MFHLKKIFALSLIAVCLMGNTISANAATKTITSYYSSTGNVVSTTITIDPGCKIYGSVICTEGSSLGHSTKWNGKMYGDLALAYTIGACSFGSDGSTTNIMDKSKFVFAGSQLVSYSMSAKMFTYYSSASTRLYY